MKIRNRTHLSNKTIMGLLRNHNDILTRYKVQRIGLFGSYARGEQKKRSDIDFLVEFKEPTFDNFMDLVFSLEKLLGRKVEMITKGNLSPYIQPYIEKEIKWHET